MTLFQNSLGLRLRQLFWKIRTYTLLTLWGMHKLTKYNPLMFLDIWRLTATKTAANTTLRQFFYPVTGQTLWTREHWEEISPWGISHFDLLTTCNPFKASPQWLTIVINTRDQLDQQSLLPSLETKSMPASTSAIHWTSLRDIILYCLACCDQADLMKFACR